VQEQEQKPKKPKAVDKPPAAPKGQAPTKAPIATEEHEATNPIPRVAPTTSIAGLTEQWWSLNAPDVEKERKLIVEREVQLSQREELLNQQDKLQLEAGKLQAESLLQEAQRQAAVTKNLGQAEHELNEAKTKAEQEVRMALDTLNAERRRILEESQLAREKAALEDRAIYEQRLADFKAECETSVTKARCDAERMVTEAEAANVQQRLMTAQEAEAAVNNVKQMAEQAHSVQLKAAQDAFDAKAQAARIEPQQMQEYIENAVGRAVKAREVAGSAASSTAWRSSPCELVGVPKCNPEVANPRMNRVGKRPS
jgi:hypothetical protein